MSTPDSRTRREPYEALLPPLVDPQPLSPDPEAQTLREISGWWLNIECGCGHSVCYPLRRMSAEHPPGRRLGEVTARLTCQKCGQRPAEMDLRSRPESKLIRARVDLPVRPGMDRAIR